MKVSKPKEVLSVTVYWCRCCDYFHLTDPFTYHEVASRSRTKIKKAIKRLRREARHQARPFLFDVSILQIPEKGLWELEKRGDPRVTVCQLCKIKIYEQESEETDWWVWEEIEDSASAEELARFEEEGYWHNAMRHYEQ